MGDHRYFLRRNWGSGSERAIVNFVMLNPSTADEDSDDATVRRCVGFAKRWGFDGMVVTNLFAYRATDPRKLKVLAARDIALAVGKHNEEHLRQEAGAAHSVVCAWGNNCDSVPHRKLEVIAMLKAYDLFCIRHTKKGNPAHPVRERYTDKPEVYRRKNAG
jgi:hypothetical protein